MLVSLAGALSRQGCDCTVAVFRDSRNPHIEVADEARRRGISVEEVPCDGRFDRRSVRHIRRLLGRYRADVLHSHGYKADLYGYAAARPGNTALISTCHNWPSQRPLMQVYAALDRFVLRNFDRAATVSDAVADILRRSGIDPKKISVISNGVDPERFRYAPPDLRREIACGREPLVGFVGRFVPGKGGEILLAAARKVIAEHPDARFAFIGDGPLRGAWQLLARSLGIEDRVVFTGSRSDMPEIYASLDIVALPSLNEGMPMCLLEALAAGKPVVATKVGAIPRIVVPGITGLLVEAGDESGLAAILRLLRDPELSAQCASNSRRRATERFSCDAMARDYIGLYEEALARRSGTRKQEALALSPNMIDEPAVQVSIVAACRNEIKHIRAFLESVLAQDMRDLAWEAVIADGMSCDGTRQAIEAYRGREKWLRVVDNPGRIVSTGLNAAIRAARGEFILRMDAHTRYAPSYTRRCLAEFERTGADNVGGPARTRAEGTGARAVAAAYHSKFSTGGACFHDEDYEGWVDTVTYGCWRKGTLLQLGLFDETLVRNQDDELNLRLVRSGGRIWQSPDITSWYSPRSKISDLFRQYFQYGFWKVAVIRKHRIPGSWRHLVPVAFVLGNVLLLALMMIAAIVRASDLLLYAGTLWLAAAALYGAASLAASVFAAKRYGWATLPYLPIVFAAYHISYRFRFRCRFDSIPARNGAASLSGLAVCEAHSITSPKRMRRLLDIVFAASVLVLVSPLLFAVALIVILSSPGPAF